MKKLSFLLILAIGAFSCGQYDASDGHGDMTHEEIVEYVKAHPDEVVDPVCGMPQKDVPYTEFSVYQGDSVHFCSPHCKGAFDKEPEKYVIK